MHRFNLLDGKWGSEMDGGEGGMLDLGWVPWQSERQCLQNHEGGVRAWLWCWLRVENGEVSSPLVLLPSIHPKWCWVAPPCDCLWSSQANSGGSPSVLNSQNWTHLEAICSLMSGITPTCFQYSWAPCRPTHFMVPVPSPGRKATQKPHGRYPDEEARLWRIQSWRQPGLTRTCNPGTSVSAHGWAKDLEGGLE